MDGSLLHGGLSGRGKLSPSHNVVIINFDCYRQQINLIPSAARAFENEVLSATLVHLSDNAQVLKQRLKDGPGLVHVNRSRHTFENPNALDLSGCICVVPASKLLASAC